METTQSQAQLEPSDSTDLQAPTDRRTWVTPAMLPMDLTGARGTATGRNDDTSYS